MLRGVDIRKADLSGADLDEAKLSITHDHLKQLRQKGKVLPQPSQSRLPRISEDLGGRCSGSWKAASQFSSLLVSIHGGEDINGWRNPNFNPRVI